MSIIQKKLLSLQPIINNQEFKNFTSFFSSEKSEDINNRVAIYEKIMLSYNLPDLAHAKQKIFQSCLQNYIEEKVLFANQLNFQEVEEANQIINEIKSIKSFFKSYDLNTFEDFIFNSVKGINFYEINAIFQDNLEKNIFDLTDKEKLTDVFLKSKSNIQNNEKDDILYAKKYSNDFLNHELVYLFSLPREDFLLNHNKYFDKFKNLADNLYQFKSSFTEERFDGAISYLIHLDITKGLDNIKEPKELQKAISGLYNSKTVEESFKKIIDLSTKNSDNYIIKDNNLIKIKNNNASHNIGINDRKFDNLVLHSKGKSNQFKQLSRAMENIANIDNRLLQSLQVTKNFSILPEVKNYQDTSTSYLNDRERMIISYSENFSNILSLYSLQRISKEQAFNIPLEIYTDNIKESIAFLQDLKKFDNFETMLYEYLLSFTIIIDKHNLLNSYKNNYELNTINQSIIEPFLNFASSIKEMFEENLIDSNYSNNFNELFSYIGSIIEKNSQYLTSKNNINIPTETHRKIKQLLKDIQLNKSEQLFFPITSILNDDEQNIKNKNFSFFSLQKQSIANLNNCNLDEKKSYWDVFENDLKKINPLKDVLLWKNIFEKLSSCHKNNLSFLDLFDKNIEINELEKYRKFLTKIFTQNTEKSSKNLFLFHEMLNLFNKNLDTNFLYGTKKIKKDIILSNSNYSKFKT